VLLLSLISFGAIIVAWIVAPEGKAPRVVETTTAVPAGAAAARA
jgi:hypothetical protein